MPYYSYHATAKRLIAEGKLKSYYFTECHRGISPALVLIFDDWKHPVMPIREERWEEYLPLISAREQDGAEKRGTEEKRDVYGDE